MKRVTGMMGMETTDYTATVRVKAMATCVLLFVEPFKCPHWSSDDCLRQ
jgi:hypothetical protein